MATSPISRDLLGLKLVEAVTGTVQRVTQRDVRLPEIRGKAAVVIGVRRGGKTSFLMQRIGERLGEGRSRSSQLLFSLEDERLDGMSAVDLGWMLERHERQYPGLRGSETMSVYLDEVKVVGALVVLAMVAAAPFALPSSPFLSPTLSLACADGVVIFPVATVRYSGMYFACPPANEQREPCRRCNMDRRCSERSNGTHRAAESDFE